MHNQNHIRNHFSINNINYFIYSNRTSFTNFSFMLMACANLKKKNILMSIKKKSFDNINDDLFVESVTVSYPEACLVIIHQRSCCTMFHDIAKSITELSLKRNNVRYLLKPGSLWAFKSSNHSNWGSSSLPRKSYRKQ